MHLEQQPEIFKVHPDLGKYLISSLHLYRHLICHPANIIGVKEESRVGIVQALWNYIKLNDLQDKVDRRLIRADAQLRGVSTFLAPSHIRVSQPTADIRCRRDPVYTHPGQGEPLHHARGPDCPALPHQPSRAAA